MQIYTYTLTFCGLVTILCLFFELVTRENCVTSSRPHYINNICIVYFFFLSLPNGERRKKEKKIADIMANRTGEGAA